MLFSAPIQDAVDSLSGLFSPKLIAAGEKALAVGGTISTAAEIALQRPPTQGAPVDSPSVSPLERKADGAPVTATGAGAPAGGFDWKSPYVTWGLAAVGVFLVWQLIKRKAG